jgi:hypothetical protein
MFTETGVARAEVAMVAGFLCGHLQVLCVRGRGQRLPGMSLHRDAHGRCVVVDHRRRRRPNT